MVWKRGLKHTNESKGYELNYLEYDAKMDEEFKRVSGFYLKKDKKTTEN